MLKKLLLAYLLLLTSFYTQAQLIASPKKKAEQKIEDNPKNEGKTKIEKKDETNSVPSIYYLGESLAVQANTQLKAGEIKNADSLIRLSIKTYPTKMVYEYVKSLYSMSDVVSANNIMKLVYQQLDSLPNNKVYVPSQLPSTSNEGKPIYPVIPISTTRAKINFSGQELFINNEFGDFKNMIKILEKLASFEIEFTGDKFNVDVEFISVQNSKWSLSVAKKEFAKAIEQIQQIPSSQNMPDVLRNMYLLEIYIQTNDYENAKKYINKLNWPYNSLKDMYEFKILANQGKNEEALKSFKKYQNSLKRAFPNGNISNDNYYSLAIIDINNKMYQQALTKLDSARFHKTMVGTEEKILSPERWKSYKLMGDAYTGLEQFEKAKDNYTIALLIYPEFEPAKEAMAKLETIIASNVSTDKTAPLINLLEPAPKRGLKITTSSSLVLLKGFAKDISGIKEVSINNKLVFAQKLGDFWGEIPLIEGINQISISATDMAGNKATQVFEVERLNPKQIIAGGAEAIQPVSIKAGRNYCLLIGAQNYSDANIPSLSNPIADAVKLKMILKSTYNFSDENVIQLFNPGTDDVKRQLLELTAQLQPEDNLLIFYAGHGIWVEKEKKGYWLMTDAKRNDVNTWLPNKTVLDLVAKIPSRHTLLITDACFSGSVFKTRGLNDAAPKPIQEMEEKISRIAITSGNDTEVPDESIFMKYLIKALNNNKEKYLTAQKMFINQILEAVMTESKTEPRYGTLELAGHIGGDFIFIKK
jgi:tetratricopeptide (TPR) repeat protein